MASVYLDFVPPYREGFVALLIYEAPSVQGPWTQIERTTEIGEYGSYITDYTTNLAVNAADWFQIAWEDEKGAITDTSPPIQGGTTTVVGRIVQRVMVREPGINENVVTDIAEWAIAKVLKTADPYGVTLAPTLDQIEGLTLLVLARSMIHSMASAISAGSSYTAGLVSQKADASAQASMEKAIDYLLREANKLLGLNLTIVMLLADYDPTGLGSRSTIGIDQTRLLLEIE